jgi:hypothetical protein
MPSRIITNKQLTDNVATLTTSAVHNLSSGTYITITNVDPTFNGSFTVSSTPTTQTFTYAKVASNVASQASSGSVIYATINEQSRPAYMYDKTTDTWFPVSGKVDTGRNYVWNGTHLFEAPVTFADPTTFDIINVSNSASIGTNLQVSGSSSFNSKININGGINVYTTATARNSAIPSPTAGTICYITGTKKMEVWDGTAWDQVLTVDQ